MKILTKTQQQNARNYIFTTGRPLEQALYRYYFEHGRRAEVWTALAAFQNVDGGFGKALEADFRAPESSALATSHALEMLRDLDTPDDHPLITSALAYLLNTFQPATGVWRIIPDTGDKHPHAPWWSQERLAETFGHFVANPRAELVGYLFTYATLVPANFKEPLLEDVLKHLESTHGPLTDESLGCYLRLHDTKELPADARQRLTDKLRNVIAMSVETNPEKWSGYCLKPLKVVNSPDAPFADITIEALQRNLDYEIDHQDADGSWATNWSWFGLYPDEWPLAEREWRGLITLNNLRALHNFGRCE